MNEVRAQARDRWFDAVDPEWRRPRFDEIFDSAANRITQLADSPIEEMFGWALLPHYAWGVDHEMFWQQFPVDRWRLDYLLTWYDPLRADSWRTSIPSRVAVELDGHQWHERTKEQAQRDRSRDRALVARGFVVLRFTGSEVWADPFAAAAHAYEQSSSSYYERVFGSSPLVGA